MSASFAFEHLWQMSEADYMRLVHVPLGDGSRTLKSYVRLGLWTTLGLLLLYFPASAGIGVLVLLGVLIAFMWPRLVRRIGDPQRVHTPYLSEAVRSGADQDGFWLSSSQYEIRVHWRALEIWELKEGWLRLAATSVPNVFLPVEEMQRRGVYEPIMREARAHGHEFDTPEALRARQQARH